MLSIVDLSCCHPFRVAVMISDGFFAEMAEVGDGCNKCNLHKVHFGGIQLTSVLLRIVLCYENTDTANTVHKGIDHITSLAVFVTLH